MPYVTDKQREKIEKGLIPVTVAVLIGVGLVVWGLVWIAERLL